MLFYTNGIIIFDTQCILIFFRKVVWDGFTPMLSQMLKYNVALDSFIPYTDNTTFYIFDRYQ